MKRWYVGIGAKDRQRSWFGATGEPTQARFPEYSAVIGPFRTKRGAMFAADHHYVYRDVREWEKAAVRAALLDGTFHHQRLYGVFWTDEHGIAMWGLHRNGRQARRYARHHAALCMSMAVPETRSWDAPTFRTCADRQECDYRPKERS